MEKRYTCVFLWKCYKKTIFILFDLYGMQVAWAIYCIVHFSCACWEDIDTLNQGLTLVHPQYINLPFALISMIRGTFQHCRLSLIEDRKRKSSDFVSYLFQFCQWKFDV